MLHLNTEPSWRGGEQQVFYLHRGLLEAGQHSVVCGQPGAPLAERLRAEGLGDDGRVVEMRMRGEADIKAVWRLRALMQSQRFDLVHMHTSHAHTLGVLAARLTPRAQRPITVVSRRVDFSIYRRSFLGLNGVKYRYGVDRYVAVSHAIRDVLVGDGLDGDRIEVVHSGIDPSRFDAASLSAEASSLREELGVPPEAPLVGNVAWFADHKGQVYLVEAAPRILEARPDARVVLVGDGELREALEQRARELGVADRVLFPGFRDDIPRCLAAFDVFVMSSHLEGLGTSVLDAMASGTPVVATRAGGIPEAVRDEETGLLVPPRDSAAIAAAVLRVLEDSSLAAELCGRAHELVRQEFSVDSMVRGSLDVYRRLVAQRKER